jgi:hypothetical protein
LGGGGQLKKKAAPKKPRRRPANVPTFAQACVVMNDAIDVLERAILHDEQSVKVGQTVVSGLLLHTFLRYTRTTFRYEPKHFRKFVRIFFRRNLRRHMLEDAAPPGTRVH